jgi:hypothetical protein
MATSGKITSETTSDGMTYHPKGAYWSFEWTAAAVEGTRGQTKVSWSIYRRGRTSSPTQYSTNCDISVKYNGETVTLLSTGNRTTKAGYDEPTSFNNKKEDSGDFTVIHNDDGTGSFTVELDCFISENQVNNSSWNQTSFSGTGTLDINQAYTSCTSPTKVTASGIVIPNGSIKVSWSG